MELNVVVGPTELNECDNPNWQAEKTCELRRKYIK